MKKILLLLIGLILFFSCEQKTPQQIERENYEYYSKKYQSYSQLFELSYKDKNGEIRTHQFVEVSTGDYMNGIDHWPDCKYCKQRGL